MFDLEISHIPGKDNTAADALSRLACPMIAKRDDWLPSYKADPKIANVYFDKKGDLLLPQAYHHGRLWDADRIVVPKDKLRAVIEQCHALVLQGH